VVEAVNDALLSVAENSSAQYMDVDLTDYSSSSQAVVAEQSGLSSDQQLLQKPSEMQPHNKTADQTADVADRVDLPEGLCSTNRTLFVNVKTSNLLLNKKHLKNVGPIRHNEPPHAHSPDVASDTVARRLRIDVHDDDNDNA